MSPRSHPAGWTLLCVTSLALALGGCGSTADEATGGENLSPAQAPDGWTPHTQGSVELHAPADWEAFDTGAPADGAVADATSFGLQAPTPEDGAGSGAFTVVTDSPQDGAVAVAGSARRTAESTLGATDVVEEEISWPGAESAAYLAYTADLPMPDGENVIFQYEFLALDLPDGGQAVVNVVGPAEGYADQAMHAVLASVTVAP
ncbi:hypothetical protein [Actinotalea sp. K2]|uniref:hypothetical protein n=1 Tax=Actinotalea sp. K2 TaxID=2939438 RepID=UPI0020182D2E|nr:hypothetical protein [Actinotalea sp. K2]MCL3859926.1 hypothetical protein [Actinotalea sp. K2]